MGRLILAAILISLPLATWAQQYRLVHSSQYPAMDIYEISRQIESAGWIEMDLSKKGALLGGSFDQIYFDPQNPERLAILKFDLELNNSQTILQISQNEFVCHGHTRRDRAFALYSQGMGQVQFSKLCQKLNRSFVSFSKFQLLKSLLPEAQAAECSRNIPFTRSIRQLEPQLSQPVILQRLGTCLLEAQRSAGHAITGLVDSIEALAHPKELWKEISAQARAFVGFVTHLKDEVTSLAQAFGDLDMDLAMHFACQLGGQLLVQAGLAVIGAGVAKLSLALAQGLLKLKKMKSIFTRLNELKSAGRSDLAREVLSCAAH